MGQLTHSIKNQWVNLKINGSSVAVIKTKSKAQTHIIYIQSIIHNENRIDFFFYHVSFICVSSKVCTIVCVCVCVKESMFG